MGRNYTLHITVIKTSCFEDIVVEGELSEADAGRIKELKKKIPHDEYAGYSPDCQATYEAMKKIADMHMVSGIYNEGVIVHEL